MKISSITTLDELVDSGIIQLTRGKIISKKDMEAYPGEFPVYSSAKENEGKFGEYGHFMFDEELITWSVDGGGRLFHRPKHKFSVTNVGGVLRIRDKSVLDYRFLYYVLSLRHSEVVFDWVKKAHPSVIKKLYKDIPVPPLPEQRRIVSILDKAFDGIAIAKANAEKNLLNARALYESHLQAVFTERGEGWVEKTLGDVCELFQGLAINVKSKHLLVPHSSLPLLRIKDLRNNSAEQFVAENGYPANARVNESEIIYTRTGQIGLVFRGRAGVLHNNCFKVRPKTLLDNDYLYWWLQNPSFRDRITVLASKAAQPDITHSLFKAQPILLPPIEEQRKAAHTIELLSEDVQCLESIYRRKLAALDELKKSLLHQAFSGQL